MFLNPFMLFGIGAISVPILIHLLNRHRIQRVRWAAMRFLLASIEKNQKRMRIEDILLLILRCVILALLALALARPTLKSAGAGFLGTGGVKAVLVIDNSLSMGTSDGVTTRFNLAKQAAEQVLDSLPTGSSIALLLGSDIFDPVIPEPTFDINLIRKSIRDAQLTDRSTQVSTSFNRALEILQRLSTGQREIYYFTDAQANGFDALPAMQEAMEKARAEIGVNWVMVGAKEDRNLSISDLRFAGGIITAGQAQRFEVKVTNNGSVEATAVQVTLGIDNEPAGDQATIDSIPPGETRSVSLFAKPRGAGQHIVKANLVADHLPADDSRTIVIRAVESVNVLVLSADGSTDREGDAFYLRHALQPVSLADRSNYYVKVTVRAGTEASTLKWDSYDVVFLVDVPDFATGAAEALADYVKRGGGLVVFPGPKISVPFYNDQLSKNLGILPATLGNPVGDAGQSEKFFALSGQGYEHPIVTIWNDPAAGNLAGAHFYRAYGLNPVENTKVVMKWSDGSPAALERDVKSGRVVMFTSSANTAWNDLPVRPGLFVPLMQRTIGRLIQRGDQGMNIGVGQRWVQRVSIDQLGRDVLITPPTIDPKVQAEQQSRKVELADGLAVVQFDDTARAGEYQAKPTGADLIRFAAQPEPQESKLDPLSDDQLAALGKSSQVIKYTAGQSLQQKISAERSGSELWMPILILVIALVAVETFFSNWFSQSK